MITAMVATMIIEEATLTISMIIMAMMKTLYTEADMEDPVEEAVEEGHLPL